MCISIFFLYVFRKTENCVIHIITAFDNIHCVRKTFFYNIIHHNLIIKITINLSADAKINTNRILIRRFQIQGLDSHGIHHFFHHT